MEFLAESIGLLDMDGSGGPYSSPHPHQKRKAMESNNSAADVAAATRSFLFFPWGQSPGSDIQTEENLVEDCGAANKASSSREEYVEGGDGDYVDNDENSPDRHDLGKQALESEQRVLDGESVQRETSSVAAKTYQAMTTAAKSERHGCSVRNVHFSSIGSFRNDGEGNGTHIKYDQMCHAIPGVLTKHVTQRIDARTNYDCFSGIVDAVTGDLIHGTMLYRRTGDVYEGPFITKYLTSSIAFDGEGRAGGCAANTTSCDTAVSLRHGVEGTCRYSNGVTFAGSFEYDRPKAGKWSGGEGGWTYEGQLLALGHGCNGGRRASFSSGDGGNQPNAIGISRLLSGGVFFHGTGRFTRPDGLIYHGDFVHGLANGVGKETMPDGRGVYHGEFCDGLRHGVGTLMEDYEEESDDGGGEDDCDFQQCEEVGDDYDGKVCCLHDQQRQGLSDAGSAAASTSSGDDDVQRSDPGPDFAAGGLQTALTPITQLSKGHRCRQHKTKEKKKKRYSSGVWCAGQYEIEDCRGTVHPERNEFTDEGTRSGVAVAANVTSEGASASNDGNHSCHESFSNLNRTTWDMLDEKWLGI